MKMALSCKHVLKEYFCIVQSKYNYVLLVGSIIEILMKYQASCANILWDFFYVLDFTSIPLGRLFNMKPKRLVSENQQTENC